MDSKLQILIQFKKSLTQFFDELISQFPEEPDLVLVRIFLNDQIPIEDTMNEFCHILVRVREKIRTRDESFFLEEHSLFQELSHASVNHFKKIWRSSRIDDEDKKVIWKWCDAFVILSDKYQECLKAENLTLRPPSIRT
jgi:hypothetical protein